MASEFPTSIDTLPDKTDGVDYPQAAEVNLLNDAVEKLEAKVGADSSAVETSHDYKLSGVTGSDVAVSKAGTETLTNKTLNSSTNTNIPSHKYKARVSLSATQENLVDGVYTKITFDTETYDPNSNFDAVTNNRYTVPVTGYYQVNGNIVFTNIVADKLYTAAIYADGAAVAIGFNTASTVGSEVANVSDVVYLTSGQVVELYARSSAGVNTVDVLGGATTTTFMSIHLLSI